MSLKFEMAKHCYCVFSVFFRMDWRLQRILVHLWRS